jgi:hypothetical protein
VSTAGGIRLLITFTRISVAWIVSPALLAAAPALAPAAGAAAAGAGAFVVEEPPLLHAANASAMRDPAMSLEVCMGVLRR